MLLVKSKILENPNNYRGVGLRGTVQEILNGLANLLSEGQSESTAWTEYCSWLSFANAGMLCRGNVYCFNHAIKNLRSEAPIVEIGSFCGLSANVITYLKEKHRKKNPLILCDKWIFEGSEKGGNLGDSTTISHSEYREFVKKTFIRNIEMFSRYDQPYAVESFSDDFFSAWRGYKQYNDMFQREVKLGGPISFCYIDGNHSYDYVKRDFENCDAFLELGGFVLFDDSSGSFPGVSAVVKNVIKTKKYKIVSKNPNYFFQKII